MSSFKEKSENCLKSICQELIPHDLKRFEEALTQALSPQKGYLSEIEMNLYKSGKKIRPLIMILSSRLFQPKEELPTKVICAAASLEMIHVATLIHDDIVDHANLRRGQISINAARGTEMAVLIGDLQFLQAIRRFFDVIEDTEDMELIKSVLDSAFKICCGEIDEIKYQSSWEIETIYKKYLSTIDRKTATLFSLSCEASAVLMKRHTSEIRYLNLYGRRLGRSFQIMDDLLDFSSTEKSSGKRKGIDLYQRRLTLPIIYAMQLFGETHPMVDYLKGKEATSEQIDAWIDEIRYSEAFILAYNEARENALSAVQMLEAFENNPYKRALSDIAISIVNQTY